MLTLRSLLFTTWVFATALIGGTVEMLIFWAPHRWQWAVAKAWADGNLWAGNFFCGLDVTTEGSENIPDEASVALIKHSTAMETYWQIAAVLGAEERADLSAVFWLGCRSRHATNNHRPQGRRIGRKTSYIARQEPHRAWPVADYFPRGHAHAARRNEALRYQRCSCRRRNRLSGGAGCPQRRRLLAETWLA